jgi:peptidoglycan hydrolase-like protein with peptidoglycan-binding domain
LKPVLGYINSSVALENYQRHTATPTNLAFVQGRDGPVQDGVEAALGLSRGDWRKLQQSLSALGFDTRGTDGKPGQNTRKAIAAWQSGKRQEATGYLTKLQRDVILSEAQPKLAALPKVLPPPQVAQVNPALVMAIRNQVMPCWSTPIGIQGVAGLRTELNIVLGPDGSVRSVQPVDTGRMSTDGVFRTFTESAVRAVYACSPLKLPPESYQVWRNIIFNFDPSQLTG